MIDITTRNPRLEELPFLRNIWKTVFGSDDEDIFFRNHFDPKLCVVATVRDDPAAVGYLLPAGYISYDGLSIPCAMIYAVATLPECRNQGYGAAIVRDLIMLGRSACYPAIVLCPSGDGLFGYYSARTELRDYFFVNEQRITIAPTNAGVAGLVGVTADEYAALRKPLLAGIPHIDIKPHLLAYQDSLCRLFGGGLFRIDTPGGVSCAVVERQSGGVVWVKELLALSGAEEAAITAIAAAFPATEYLVRTPARGTGGQIKRFGMIAAPLCKSGSMIEGCAPWYGLAFE